MLLVITITSHVRLNLSFSAYGSLTVRSLLDTREHCLAEFHFVDPYSQVDSSFDIKCKYNLIFNVNLMHGKLDHAEYYFQPLRKHLRFTEILI